MANVLAVFAHPDDEVLGCGGTLAKHVENDDDPFFILAVGREMEPEAWKAAAVLGIHDEAVWPMNYADQRLDEEPFLDVVLALDMVIGGYGEIDFDVIYTHHPADLNRDHQIIANAVLTAFRPKPDQKPRTILACEVPSSTEYTYPRMFQPNWYEPLTAGQLDKKIEALKCYPSELQEFPHPRSAIGVRNVAAVRGQEVGVQAAEAFQLLRRVS